MSLDTRTRLLQAAETILVQDGVHALTVRRIGEVSTLNPTLVTYHFGTMAALLGELLEQNLEPMRKSWAALLAADPVDEPTVQKVLELWLKPLLAPAAFNPAGRALVVIDEIASHGSRDMSEVILREMISVAGTVASLLAPALPHLSPAELRERLRMIAGAALGPPPRLPASSANGTGADKEHSASMLLRFALASLGGH